MRMKKVPISFNNEDLENINELINLMGIANTYGDFPKAVKYGIKLALSTIKNPEKVYTSLKDDEIDIFFKSVKNFEMSKRAKEKAKEYEKLAKKYNS